MAKYKKSLFRLQGTLAGLTFVDSATYGAHTRLPRGTHKKASLNPSMRKKASNTKLVTTIGGPIRPHLYQMGDGFTQKGIWRQMMAKMFKAEECTYTALLKSLEGLELNDSYRLKSIVHSSPAITINTKGSKCNVELQTTFLPSFPSKIKANSYYYEVYILWLDGKASKYEWEAKQTDWLPMEHKPMKLLLAFDKPLWAKYRVVIVKVQGGDNEREIESFASMGMQVREGGKA